MKKKILCLMMMALLILGSTLTVNAEDFVGSRDWTVNFDGKKMNSNFKSAEMTQDILNILPGDSITLQINLKSDDHRKTDWYMSNEVLKSLEDSSEAEGGAYTYILSYYDPEGKETVLYSSDVVGGEGGVIAGLHQASAGLEDYFYLDRLENSENAKIRLYVKLDGETQGNDYQDTLARLKINFAVERVYDDVINETITQTKLVTLSNVVKTGDSSPVLMFSSLALASGIVLLIVAVIVMKRKRNERGE